ncbi:MAG: Flp pilus assembly complex ATPase component TadA [Planctomycetes bacterium]|nr:Flp pilus assembly complex ATPase component TadA [Planctomycetota bacterium]MBL7042968.1 Flp pilus assembly complex ATPase component TadA [Pirellulaceae bacterium]
MDAGEILLNSGLIDPQQLQRSRAHEDASVLDAAIELGFVNEEDALRAVGGVVGLEYMDLSTLEEDKDLASILETFPQKLIYRESLFPIRRKNGALIVATSNPFDLYPIDEASAATGLSVLPVLAGRDEIARLIKKHLGVGRETVEGMIAQVIEEDEIELLGDIETDGSELSDMAQEASVIRLVNEILLEALESRASDVHVESQSAGLTVRYRIDGILHTQPMPPEMHRFEAAIVSRLKIMARLNIAERRLPQDGRMKLKVKGREIDVRVSVLPMIHGEGIVMRLLDKSAMVFELRSLGIDGAVYDVYRKLIELPHGIILFVGPTGCGKTTSLYASLLEINQPDIKIITTEDPVEYQLQGINQIQVHSKIGLTFARSLRSILRHDPDVVLVGEIRDLETAENAIQASLTGHLVFSTLHTNDAAGAYTRLVDMGVEPFLVSSTVEAVMAQRLARRLCEHCKRLYDPKQDGLPPDFPWEELAGGQIYEAVGCRECRHVGYRGRLGVFELMPTTKEVRHLAHENASTWEIKKAAIKNGMSTLRVDGWRKVLAGQTSVAEIVRVTKGDTDVELVS